MIVGIDLGTTNSAISVFQEGQPKLIPNALGEVLTPSVVSVDTSGEILVGIAARDRQTTHPDRTAAVFKRYMGSSWRARLGDMELSPEELSAIVLRSLKADAEAYLGEPVIEAVIAVPAYFNDKQRKATRRAGEFAGFKVDRLINEPTAAALAYGILDRGREASFIVFDLGGGTFDVSVLELFEGVIEVRASAGDNRLGGEDFNELLVAQMRERRQAAFGGLGYGDALYQRLRAAAERARRALSSQDSATMSVTWNGATFEDQITIEGFDKLAEPLLARLRDPVLRALRDGKIRSEDLDEVVLVGGATRMPTIRRAVAKMFGRFPAMNINPDEAIARGAAIQAGLKSRDAALSELVLTDVCPFSLGVEVSERGSGGQMTTGLFAPILERNSVIPASRVHSFATLQDGQAAVDFKIYQGESRWVRDNVQLGTLTVAVPKRRAGEATVECRFSYDINGLLEVDTHVPATGERRNLVIADEDTISSASFESMRAALAAFKTHPREAAANLSAMARAARCYEDNLGDTRDYVGRLISNFEMLLEKQEPRGIEAARVELMKALDALEGSPFL